MGSLLIALRLKTTLLPFNFVTELEVHLVGPRLRPGGSRLEA